MDVIKRKRQRFNILLRTGHMTNAKEYILGSYNVNSTTELTEKQLDDAILRVQRIIDEKFEPKDLQMRELRHKCLRMVAACGVDTQDWKAVNAFMLDKRIAGKHLYELSIPELNSLQRKLHAVAENINIKKQQETRLQIMN